MTIQSLSDFRVAIATLNRRRKGSAFEIVVKSYLTCNSYYQDLFEDVWLLKEFPSKQRKQLNLPRKDKGIDLIAQTKDGEYWAIQAKYKSNTSSRLGWKELSTFHTLAFQVCSNINTALVCSTASNVVKEANRLSNTQFLLNNIWSKLGPQYFVNVTQWLESQKQEQAIGEHLTDIHEDCYWCGLRLYGDDHKNIWLCGYQEDCPHQVLYFAHLECIPPDYQLLAPISALCTNEGFTQLKNTLLTGSFAYQNYSDLYWDKENALIEFVMSIAQRLNMRPQYYDNGLAAPSLKWWSSSKAHTEEGIKEILRSVCGVEAIKVSIPAPHEKRTLAEFENKYGGKSKFKEQIEARMKRYEKCARESQSRLDDFSSQIGSQPTQHQLSELSAYQCETDLYRNALMKTLESCQAYDHGEYESADRLLREANGYARSAWAIFE